MYREPFRRTALTHRPRPSWGAAFLSPPRPAAPFLAPAAAPHASPGRQEPGGELAELGLRSGKRYRVCLVTLRKGRGGTPPGCRRHAGCSERVACFYRGNFKFPGRSLTSRERPSPGCPPSLPRAPSGAAPESAVRTPAARGHVAEPRRLSPSGEVPTAAAVPPPSGCGWRCPERAARPPLPAPLTCAPRPAGDARLGALRRLRQRPGADCPREPAPLVSMSERRACGVRAARPRPCLRPHLPSALRGGPRRPAAPPRPAPGNGGAPGRAAP